MNRYSHLHYGLYLNSYPYFGKNIDFDGDEYRDNIPRFYDNNVLYPEFVARNHLKQPLIIHPNSLYQFYKNKCMNCWRSTTKYCQQCKLAYYCSKECQIRDYVLHKEVCTLQSLDDDQLEKKLCHEYGRGDEMWYATQRLGYFAQMLFQGNNECLGLSSYQKNSDKLNTAILHKDVSLLRFLLNLQYETFPIRLHCYRKSEHNYELPRDMVQELLDHAIPIDPQLDSGELWHVSQPVFVWWKIMQIHYQNQKSIFPNNFIAPDDNALLKIYLDILLTVGGHTNVQIDNFNYFRLPNSTRFSNLVANLQLYLINDLLNIVLSYVAPSNDIEIPDEWWSAYPMVPHVTVYNSPKYQFYRDICTFVNDK